MMVLYENRGVIYIPHKITEVKRTIYLFLRHELFVKDGHNKLSFLYCFFHVCVFIIVLKCLL